MHQRQKPVQTSHFILVDYENVQPESLRSVDIANAHVIVFLGAHQARVTKRTEASIAAMRHRPAFVKIMGSGKNALDFHISHYLGRYAALHPKASFHIVSNDKGFDPLVAHLQVLGTAAQRSGYLPDLIDPAEQDRCDDLVTLLADNLRKRGGSRPASWEGLRKTAKALFRGQVNDEDVAALVDDLASRGWVTQGDGRLLYRFDDAAYCQAADWCGS
jgi:hypothetical protein